jgi:hypothetical protein
MQKFGSKKVSSEFEVYKFPVFQQIAACNSMLSFSSIIGRLSMVKSIYLSNQKRRFRILELEFSMKPIHSESYRNCLFTTVHYLTHWCINNDMSDVRIFII